MSAERCSLVWKASALEDGRLDGADRASFEEHVSRCADCRAEKKALAALYAKVRAIPSPDVLPLDHARRRGVLLARANERFLRPRRRAAPSRVALIALAVLVVGGSTAFFVQRRTPVATPATRSVAAVAPAAPRYDVTGGAHAIWRAREDGPVVRVDVADGEATLHVEPLAAPQRFLVLLPDGELEVTAGRFTVDVALGRTRSVNVAEGRLVLRRRDEPDVRLAAGDGWKDVQPVSVTSAAIASAASPAATTAPRARSSAAVAPQTATAPLPALRAGEKFDEGIGSFVNGGYARADVELHEFIEEFPHDARCEDAAFLSAVARWRMGDAAGARARAESYLATYPRGLRRSEAQHIVDLAR